MENLIQQHKKISNLKDIYFFFLINLSSMIKHKIMLYVQFILGGFIERNYALQNSGGQKNQFTKLPEGCAMYITDCRDNEI